MKKSVSAAVWKAFYHKAVSICLAMESMSLDMIIPNAVW